MLDELEARSVGQSEPPGRDAGGPRRAAADRWMQRRSAAKRCSSRANNARRPDRWQQLRLAHVPEPARGSSPRAARDSAATIDAREAYVDAIVLVVPGGRDNTTVWTDALEVDGIVHAGQRGVDSVGADHSGRGVRSKSTLAGCHAANRDRNRTRPPLEVQFHGTTLIARRTGRFLPLGIEWNNEPFAFLAARGFNTIWLDEPPTPEQSAEAVASQHLADLHAPAS